jgi:hypothetical protein
LDTPTVLPSESQPHNEEQRHHAVHMHMHLSQLSPSVSDEDYRYSELYDYCTSISLHMLANK